MNTAVPVCLGEKGRYKTDSCQVTGFWGVTPGCVCLQTVQLSVFFFLRVVFCSEEKAPQGHDTNTWNGVAKWFVQSKLILPAKNPEVPSQTIRCPLNNSERDEPTVLDIPVV